jgi:hypothetical protein
MMNNLSESLAAYSFTLPGRDEIRKCEKRYSTRGPDIPSQGVFPIWPDAVILKGYCQEEIPYDDIITAVLHFAVNSESMIEKRNVPKQSLAVLRADQSQIATRGDRLRSD